MKLLNKRLMVILATVVALVFAGQAAAQTETVAPCSGEQVSGLVIAVDVETRTIIVETETGPCSVQVGESNGVHPVAAMLGQFFAPLDLEALQSALAATQGCIQLDAVTNANLWTKCEEGMTQAVIVMVDEDGNFFAQTESGLVQVQVGEEAALALRSALLALQVDLQLSEGGMLENPAEYLEEIHSQGIGFGVLAKLMSMAEENAAQCELAGEAGPSCQVTLEALVAAYQSGVTLEELYAQYGKPAFTGVGHFRHSEREPVGVVDDGEDDSELEDGEEGVANPGKKNGHGKHLSKPNTDDGDVDDDGDGDDADDGADEGDTGDGEEPKEKIKDKEKENGSGGEQGVCNARENGGKAKGNGHAEITCP